MFKRAKKKRFVSKEVRYNVKGTTDGSVVMVVWQFIDVRHRETEQ